MINIPSIFDRTKNPAEKLMDVVKRSHNINEMYYCIIILMHFQSAWYCGAQPMTTDLFLTSVGR